MKTPEERIKAFNTMMDKHFSDDGFEQGYKQGLADRDLDIQELKTDFIQFLNHIESYPVQLTTGLRSEIENYKTKLLKV